jgi:hypothetical protein
MGIPLKAITDSATKPISIPEESDQVSERSDAGSSIVRGSDRLRQGKKLVSGIRSEAEAVGS